MIHHRLVEHEIEAPADIAGALDSIAPNGYELSLLERGEESFRVRVVETETVPTTKVAGWILVPDGSDRKEPIGTRVIETAEDYRTARALGADAVMSNSPRKMEAIRRRVEPRSW